MHDISVMEILKSKQNLSDDQRSSRVLEAGTSISNEREEITTCHKLGEHVSGKDLANILVIHCAVLELTSYCWTE
jgi:hypothetical protein